MSNYRYELEKYSGSKTRFECPKCENKSNTFVRYVDNENGEYIDDEVGRCNREDKCGYHLKPQQFFEKNGKGFVNNIGSHGLRSAKKVVDSPPKTYIPREIYDESMPPARNNFLAYLRTSFGDKAVMKLRETYRIGSSEHWEGATVFWQIDSMEMIRTGKILLYDRNTGRRIKQPYNHISWVHSSKNLPNFELKQCLFGEHLLVGNNMPVGIVESEKTAIICSHFIPNKIWLATGGKGNLKADLFENLKDRNVTFYPDLGAYETWKEKIKNELTFIPQRYIDSTLENCATEQERIDGLDIADFLLINNSLFD